MPTITGGIKINNEKLKTCIGITSQCPNDKHVVFLDFDNKDIGFIVSELEKLQHMFRLSDFYVITTTNGYNAFSLDKVSLETLLDIYKESNLVCQDFVKYCLMRGYFTLRIGKDKQHILTVTSNTSFYTKSHAHKDFFNNMLKFAINDNNNFDNNHCVIIDSYNSKKHGVCRLNENTKRK